MDEVWQRQALAAHAEQGVELGQQARLHADAQDRPFAQRTQEGVRQFAFDASSHHLIHRADDDTPGVFELYSTRIPRAAAWPGPARIVTR